MPPWLLSCLNVLFFVFHTILILFNVLGWLWRRTRIWNLGLLILTALSWFVMGIWYGAGYCICTDWHWQVRHVMGIHGDPDNYIQLLVRSITGWMPGDQLSRTVAGVCFGISLVGSLVLNIIDFRRRRIERSVA